MWPFKKKQQTEKRDTFDDVMRATGTKIFAAFPIGKNLEYLGRQMVVIDHIHYRPSCDGGGYFYIPRQMPKVITEYADNAGKIHTHEFDATDIVALLPNADLRHSADSAASQPKETTDEK